jgi:DNA polymerase-1
MPSKKILYLVDASAYIHRAFHAIRGLSTSQGFPTNAAFGYTRILLSLLKRKNPAHAIVVFDAKGPTFRHELFPSYKANRPPMDPDLVVQIPFVKKITQALNLPMMEQQGFEADDIIGSLARQAQDQGFSVVMITGDKDFNQLLSENCTLWDPMKDVEKTPETMMQALGLPPESFVDVMALWGDSSDNVPGVPGIGEKTAAALVREYRNLEGIYENLDRISAKKQRENLEANRQQAFLSRRLVTIDTNAPVSFSPEQSKIGEPDRAALSALFKELEFRQLLEEFSDASPGGAEKDYRALTDESALKELVENLLKASEIAVDTETTSTRPMEAALVGISLSLEPHKAFYVPVGHSYQGVPAQIPLEKALEILRPVLEGNKPAKTGQNIKYDWIVLARHGIELTGVDFDTMVASYLINPAGRAHSLDQIALDLLNHKTISYKETAGSQTFDKVPIEKAAPYACEDADITLMAKEKLAPLLEENQLTELFKTVEMPLVEVLKNMEMRGIRVDVARLGELSGQFADEMARIEEQIYSVAGEKFNISSPQQLGRILFEKLNLPTGKKTKKKTGYSTDVSVLTDLAAEHELPAMILRYRSLAKLKSTYTDALMGLVHPQTNRVHTSFNQNVTATGRLSSSDPNLQNIPIRTAEGRQIREAFVPEPGWKMFSADYSQIELRILAHYAKDPVLLDSFARGEDIHLRTASEVFRLNPAFVTEQMRREAKAINFGLIYGMGPFKLSRELGISQKLAKRYMENYFATYKGVKAFMESAIESARQTRRTTTLAGRIRLLPEITSKDRVTREAAERTAINTPIQGTAADFIKIAMIRVDRALREKGLKTAMLLTVHDELVFEAPPDELDSAMALVVSIMESVWDLAVPLKVNAAVGENWAQAH